MHSNLRKKFEDLAQAIDPSLNPITIKLWSDSDLVVYVRTSIIDYVDCVYRDLEIAEQSISSPVYDHDDIKIYFTPRF
jgi:hypothetical protein